MTYNILATGSSGNAVLINDNILVDIGVPFAKLAPHAGKIKLVLTTHIHSDHFKPSTVRKLHQLHPAIRFGCCEWMAGTLLEAGVDKRVIDVLRPRFQFDYGEFTVQAERVSHNVENCGYKIMIFDLKNNDAETVFYATDCATLDGIEAKNFDLYMIEANHRRAEIEARIAEKQAAGEFAYEVEACRNHLSYEQAMDWLAANAGPNSRYILLHQHREKENHR